MEQETKRGQSPIVLSVRGSAEYRAWVDALAKQMRCPVAQLVDRALADLAKSQNFSPPPER